MKKQKLFWPNAKVTNTLRRYDPGTKKTRQKIDMMFGRGAFLGLRRYEHEGSKKISIEIDKDMVFNEYV